MSRGTLLLYLGNPIAGDDGIGLEVGVRLAGELGASGTAVTAREFSGSPLDLLGAVEGYDRLILLDAVATGAPVGTVKLFDERALMARRGDTYPHGLNLPEALALGRRLGADLPARIHLIGVEIRPALAFASGFSPELADRLPAILTEARRLLADLLKGETMAKKVLLVDDDYDFILATRTVIEAAGYAVQTAGGGKEGLQKVRSFQPDLVVLDVMMPAPDGWEVCETLKASSDTRAIPVIMLTAVASHVKDTEFTHQAGKATEADDYLPPPVSPQVLLERIKKLLR